MSQNKTRDSSVTVEQGKRKGWNILLLQLKISRICNVRPKCLTVEDCVLIPFR